MLVQITIAKVKFYIGLVSSLIELMPKNSLTHLPLVLCVELRTFAHPFWLIGATLVQLMFIHSCWWDFMDITSDITMRKIAHSKLHNLWLPQSFCPLLHNIPLVLVTEECFVHACIETGLHNSAFRLIVVSWV